MEIAVRERKSPFIHLNDTGKPGIVCEPFYAVSYYIGCPYKCAYCYLQGTFRGHVDPVVYTNRVKLLEELDEWLKQDGHLRLNAGEIEDSLALDGKIPLVNDLVTRFAAQDRHKLLLVSKSVNVQNLLRLNPRGQVIVAFSVNAPNVSKRFELGAPPPLERVKAAAKVKQAGYYVTLRLDPMIPVDCWTQQYPAFIKQVYEHLWPDQWTIGSLRYFPSLPVWTRKVGRDPEIYHYATEYSPEDRRRRVPMNLRAAMYQIATESIRKWDQDVPVRMCKETTRLYQFMNIIPTGCCYNQALRRGSR